MGVLYETAQITEALVRQKDNFIFEQFERHGIERSKVHDLLWSGRISIMVHGNMTDYCIDGIAYFGIYEDEEMGIDEGAIKFTCYDILPPKVGL